MCVLSSTVNHWVAPGLTVPRQGDSLTDGCSLNFTWYCPTSGTNRQTDKFTAHGTALHQAHRQTDRQTDKFTAHGTALHQARRQTEKFTAHGTALHQAHRQTDKFTAHTTALHQAQTG